METKYFKIYPGNSDSFAYKTLSASFEESGLFQVENGTYGREKHSEMHHKENGAIVKFRWYVDPRNQYVSITGKNKIEIKNVARLSSALVKMCLDEIKNLDTIDLAPCPRSKFSRQESPLSSQFNLPI